MTKSGLENGVGKPALGDIGVYASFLHSPEGNQEIKSPEKWQVLATTRKLLYRDPDKKWATCNCRRYIAYGHKTIDTLYSLEKERAYLKGVQTCKSAWVCPICSLAIAAGRKEEITKIVMNAAAKGYKFGMLTPTVQHTRDDDLKPLFKFFAKEIRDLFQGARKRKFDAMGLLHRIRAWEVRLGFLNGWHPHAHILLFFKPDADIDGIVDLATKAYCRRLAKKGYLVNGRTINFELMCAEDAIKNMGDYATKEAISGVDSLAWEMTGDSLKVSKKDSLSGLQLVQAYMLTKEESLANSFIEFANATKGRKKIQYSANLRADLLPDEEEKSDDELVEEGKQDDPYLVKLRSDQWSRVSNLNIEKRYFEVVGQRDAEMSNKWLVSMGIVENGELTIVDGVLVPSSHFGQIVGDDGVVRMVHLETGEVLEVVGSLEVAPVPATVVTAVSLSYEAPRPVGRKSTAATLLSLNISDGQTGSQRMLSIIPDLGEGWFDDG